MRKNDYTEAENVFEALGFAPVEAANLTARAELMVKAAEIIKTQGLTQAQAAKMCGVSQPRISDLMNFRGDRFSVDTLMEIVALLGGKVEIHVKAA